MAEVYLARTTVAQGLTKSLVIKKIHPAFARSHQFQSMFVDEAKITLGLNHPNIVQVFDFGQVGKTFFLAMEHVDGLDVLRLLEQTSAAGIRIPLGLASYIVQQVAKGLDYAHRKLDDYGDALGIVHRDVSPQNVLVSWDGSVKIVDFGIARARGVHEEAGVIKGKFAYMSPEQARGEEVDRRSDVYSAGVLLFELVTGRPMFPGKGKQVLEQVRSGAIPAPRELRPDLPKELEHTIRRALTFHPDDRFQTARDLQNALGRFQFDHARSADALIDSGSLAQFVAKVIPADQRRQQAGMPPSTAGTPMATPAPTPTDARAVPDIDTASGFGANTPKPTTEVRERKYVFVIEGQVCGVSSLERRLGNDGADQVVKAFFRVAEDIAYKHDAHIHQVTRVGFTFVVGLPVAAENDASRAIRLSLALVDALDGIGAGVEPELRLAIGIQRGSATLTRHGGGRKFTYELARATTSIANTLAKAAQGAEILIGGRVYRVSKDDWNFEELTSIEVPADTDTQPGLTRGDEDTEPGTRRARVYRLRGPKQRAQRMKERAGRATALVGRDLELKALRDGYRDALVSRRKRTFVIIGDAGVGKRSLVSAFLAGVPKGEAVVMRAAARVSTAYTPFAIVADLARDLLGLADGAAPKEVQKRIERVVALLYAGKEQSREVRGAVQVMGMLLGGRPAEAGDDIDATERRARILEAMRRVENGLARDKPLIAIGEDVHWADEQSMLLFLELLTEPSGRPILGIVTARPNDRIEKLARQTDATLIRIEELDEDARRSLILDQFAPDEDVGGLASQILARTGGNPFFVREVLDSLQERGIIARADADDPHAGLLRWLRRDAPIQVPTSVESLLSTRIDRLDRGEKEALLVSAVLGRVVNLQAVEALWGAAAREPLEALVERGLMSREANTFAFRNDMTMSVAYGLLPEIERNQLHQRAAELLATSKAYRPGQDDAVIARHLELASEGKAAAKRYLRAARHAVDVGGNADAFRQLTRALKLLPERDFERRFTARTLREQILGRLARRPEQLREIHKLREVAEKLRDDSKIARAYARLAQFYIDVGKAPAASRAVGSSLEHARDGEDQLAEAEGLRLRSSIARLVGNNEEALGLCKQALALCGEDRDGLEQRAMVLNNRGTALWNMSRLQEAIESYAEALVIYRKLGLPRQEARALNNMGIVFAALGEFEESLSHYKSSLRIDQKLGDRASIALKLGNIGQAYADLGDATRGERYLVKALSIADQMDDRSSATDIAISLGQAYIGLGRLDKAMEMLERGLALATENRERYQEIRALIYLALAQLEVGDSPEGALQLARSATELARKMPMPVGEIFGRAAQGRALSVLGEHDDACSQTRKAVALQKAHKQPEGSEQILYFHVQACDAAGRHEEALQALRRAQADVDGKAGRITDPELRAVYLASAIPAAIARDLERVSADK